MKNPLTPASSSSPPRKNDHVWAIVLAAGEGTRLAAVTTALHGRAIPKQFAALFGERTFIQRTVDRILPLVPASRIVVVVADSQMELATAQLAHYPGIVIVRQPANRGTGAGVLLPLAHVLARDPDARVVVLPSDHHVAKESRFLDAVKQAIAAADHAATGVSLVGSAAEAPATDLGWIVCRGGETSAKGRQVARFVEKPREAEALDLLAQGALWNTLIIAARGCALWLLATRHVGAVATALGHHQRRIGSVGERQHLDEVYRGLPSTDLSRDILEKANGLHAVAMIDAGWSDCGTPERLALASASLPRCEDRWTSSALQAAG
ncbi:MAG TPA: sugar phosphate nucleotidyltransferase [Polyangia bacterium]